MFLLSLLLFKGILDNCWIMHCKSVGFLSFETIQKTELKFQINDILNIKSGFRINNTEALQCD